ncbi:unnamed protein product [Adineta steineri]|uniref:alpha-L-rhamnosidase n=2 Tax=Adineta steineri TaxID=433720 RepID=A0A813VHW8_9BILA|nr:unnamed protein product [Adineta steineri]
MFYVRYFSTLLLILLWSANDAHNFSLFDIRIDHWRVKTRHDLVINTPRPRFSWKIRALDDILHRNIQQIAYQIQINSVKLTQQDEIYQWDSERIISSQSIHVAYAGHHDLLPSTFYRFRLRVWINNSDVACEWIEWIQFRTAIFNLHEYIINNTDLLWIGSTEVNMNELRKEFNVSNASPIKLAIVYLSGLGYYEFYLNGNNVDPSRKLDPGWTTYEKRTLLVSFDLTANISVGMNAIGIKLGNGWYSQEQHGKETYGPPRLIFTLSILFENGDQMQVLSDQTWLGREGSIKHDSVYNGEIYDRRGDRLNWTRPAFNDSRSAWIMPESLKSPINDTSVGLLVLQDMPPIRAGSDALHTEVMIDSLEYGYLNHEDLGNIKGASFADGGIIKPVDMWISDSGMFAFGNKSRRINDLYTGVQTFDLGQNIVGWCRLKFQGPSGFGTYIRHAEILVQPVVSTNHATHNLNTENLRNATASDMYILRGDRLGEVYEPSFTIHGFRYLSVFGAPNYLNTDNVECLVVHSETTLKGHFTTSNPIINQIQHNIQWGQLSNLMSVPTDCPQRDERRGWLGDAALSVDEALYNFDLIKFYLNFLNLIVDMQLPNGAIPDIVPGGGGIYPADPNWGAALPIITWQLYRHYEDRQILEDYYDHIRAYIENVRSGYNDTGLKNLFWRYGDWLPPSPFPRTNEHLTSSFAFLHNVYILLNMSQILEKKHDTDIYSLFYQQLAEEFHRVFFNTTSNCYADGMQAAQVLALALPGVVPPTIRNVVLNYLVNNINLNGNHATTGIVSMAQLYPVLSDNGYHDLALEMISLTTYPSYGYMFTNPYENATTLWELLNAPFLGPMSSRNHIMYGSIGSWFYSHLAGIDLSSEFITIRPRMASEMKKHLMTKLDCQLSTLYGLVRIAYTRDERDTLANSILLRITIPPNTRARIIFEPLFVDGQCEKLIESDTVIWSLDNTTIINHQKIKIEKNVATNLMTAYIESGQYEFQALWT